ncbi:MAG: hypothetical protein ACPLTR_05995 [Thermacetogeniaceae bacterium]
MYERQKKAVGRPEKCAQNEHISKRTAEKIASLKGQIDLSEKEGTAATAKAIATVAGVNV